jgi:septal ring factor EnvC (AmiA/AmiB activator)
VTTPGAQDARPRLVRGGAEQADARAPRPTRRRLSWVIALLLACALGAAALQTNRLARMTERADQLAAESAQLRTELGDAQAQIRSFEKQRDLVRESVSDLAARVAALSRLLTPAVAPTAAAPPPAEPSAQLPHPEGR